MNSLNQQTMVGRVGQDPDIRYFESGTVKAVLTLAVKPPYKSDIPLWFDVELWGKSAEVAASYVKKGSTIGVFGELVVDHWQDKNTGEERFKPVVRCSNLELISSSKINSAKDSASDEVEANF